MQRNFTGLVKADPGEQSRLNAALPVCAGITLKDLDGWERMAIPQNDPRVWGLTKAVQNRNDCRANSGTTAREVMLKRFDGVRIDLSRMHFYQGCELRTNKLGSDSGVSMQSGVSEWLERGCPSEKSYAYDRYTANKNQYLTWSNPCKAEAEQYKIKSASPASPDFDVAVALAIIGLPTDIGTMWPLKMDSNMVVHDYTGYGPYGHATVIVWAEQQPSGEWRLLVWNSHHNWFYWLTRKAYTGIIEANHFGAYVYLEDLDPRETFHNYVESPLAGKRH
jgi:hypothetical protein